MRFYNYTLIIVVMGFLFSLTGIAAFTDALAWWGITSQGIIFTTLLLKVGGIVLAAEGLGLIIAGAFKTSASDNLLLKVPFGGFVYAATMTIVVAVIQSAPQIFRIPSIVFGIIFGLGYLITLIEFVGGTS